MIINRATLSRSQSTGLKQAKYLSRSSPTGRLHSQSKTFKSTKLEIE